MPRRALPIAAASSSALQAPPPPPHPIARRLRRSWKFAAVCQFLFVFDEAFGMSGFETESLENDFAGPESNVIPDLMKRLLYTLTLDRRIELSNWQEHLWQQYLARDPEANPFGTVEEPRSWDRLSIDDKITSLHNLCEWQLQDPERFRKLVKSEEDTTTWRVAPIGWDADDNAYWLFDDNRIWIQRPAPPPPPAKKAAAKARTPARKGSKRARTETAAAKRAAAAASSPSARSTPAKSMAAKRAAATPASGSRSSPRKRGRVSEIEVEESDSGSVTPSKKGRGEHGKVLARRPPARGTRTSSRFAKDDADEDNSDSDLSDPPDEGDDEEQQQKVETTEAGDGEAAEEEVKEHAAKVIDEDVVAAEEQPAAEKQEDAEAQAEELKMKVEETEEWVEFETIVITRTDWLEFAARFGKSKDLNERNLHNFVNEEILPTVLANFDEQDRQRVLEAALANRKRSSRIAIKESEKEERERDREARARMEEKMARLRQEDDEKKAREEEELKAQKSREERIREREERIFAREREAEEKAIREEMEREQREREREERKRRRDEIIANGGVPPSEDATATPEPHQSGIGGGGGVGSAANGLADAAPVADDEEENWELGCEVCGKAGINPPDEGREIVCCETCGVWQHVKCWNKFDKHILNQRKNRDWANVDFYCTKCRPPPAGVPVPTPGMQFLKREKPSPSGGSSVGRNSQDPETPTRQKIRLVNRSSGDGVDDVDGTSLAAATSGATSAPIQTPTLGPTASAVDSKQGVQAAETGLLTSSGAASRTLVAAPSPLPTPAGVGPGVEPSRLPSAQPLPGSSTSSSSVGGETPATQGKPILATAASADASPAPSPLGRTAPDSTAPEPPSTPSGAGAMLPPASARMAASSHQHDAAAGSPGGTAIAATGVPPRSPSISGPGSSAKYARPSQSVGSFPIRHTPAKSPLSRPYDSGQFQNGSSGPPALLSNGDFSLGPSRAISPSPSRGNGAGSSSSTLTPTKADGLQSGIALAPGRLNSPFGSAASSPPSLPAVVRSMTNGGGGGGGASRPGSLVAPDSSTTTGHVAGAVSSVPLFSPAMTTAVPILGVPGIGGQMDGSPNVTSTGAASGPVAPGTATATAANKQFGPSPPKNPFGSPFAKAAGPSAGAAGQAFKVLEAGERKPPSASAMGLGFAGPLQAAVSVAASGSAVVPPTVMPDAKLASTSTTAPAEGNESVSISTPAAEGAKVEVDRMQEETIRPERPRDPAPTPVAPRAKDTQTSQRSEA